MEIRLKQVSKQYRNTKALDEVNLTVPQGMFGLLGPNGAGKTTLMRILMALLPADSGEIVINGMPIQNHTQIRERVSYLPQDFSFYPSMTVREAMDYMGLLAGINSAAIRSKRIQELLTKVNLLAHKKKKFKALSGGMKRRLGIAIALLKDPEVLIVDEPTAGLDPDERVRIRTLLSDFAKDRIVLLSTHIVEDIEHTCRSIAIINQGRIVFEGSKIELMKEADGRVRNLQIADNELSEVQNKYEVVSMVANASGYVVKIITDESIGEPVGPSMEDAYLVKMRSIRQGNNMLEQTGL